MQNDNCIKEKKIEDYTIKIYYDENPESPREWDNLTVLICFHKRYNLGDSHSYRHDHYNSWEEMKKDICRNEDVALISPLYLMDHSGISISMNDFKDRWDSGMIGFVFITKDTIRKEQRCKKVTQRLLRIYQQYMEGEVKIYDQYLRGDVHGYKIFDKDDEEIDSCYGYYGIESCMEEAESIIECLNKGV